MYVAYLTWTVLSALESSVGGYVDHYNASGLLPTAQCTIRRMRIIGVLVSTSGSASELESTGGSLGLIHVKMSFYILSHCVCCGPIQYLLANLNSLLSDVQPCTTTNTVKEAEVSLII